MPLWRGDHVAVKQLVEDFARYLYLPRLAGPEVLVAAIRDGLGLLIWQKEILRLRRELRRGRRALPGTALRRSGHSAPLDCWRASRQAGRRTEAASG